MPEAGNPLLRCESLGKWRMDEQGKEVAVLRNINLALTAGRITVLIGPSGGGKSTLLRLLNRLEEPSSGRVLFKGREIGRYDPRQLRRQVALVAQKPFVFRGTVLDNLQLPGRFQNRVPPSGDDPQLQRLLALCRLPVELLERDARTLSVGQQQRLCLARSLTTEPEVLLLDEPTSALDRPTVAGLADSLRAICGDRRLAVLLATHDLRLAERVADDLAYLEGGCLLEQGPAEDLLRRPRTIPLQRFLQPSTDEQG